MIIPDLKHPLSIPVKAGLSTLQNLGLRAETSLRDNVADFYDYSSVLFSAHAPTTIGQERLNIAATDDEFRKLSIAVFTDYVDKCSTFPNIRQLNMHFGLKRWASESQPRGRFGEYEIHIESIRTIAQHAAKHNLEIVLENLNCYWAANGISEETMYDEVDWKEKNEAFGMCPEEWIQMCVDADMENVRLCLDSSHVCTYAHRYPESERQEKIAAFLSRPDLISHVHWSDNYLYEQKGRKDSHLSVGTGTIPIDFHRDVKALDATILLEHFYTLDELMEELKFINSL